MREYEVCEVKAQLAELLKKVRQGESFTITNRSEPVADIVSSANRARNQAKNAIQAIKEMRKGSLIEKAFDEMQRQGRR